MRWTKGVVGGAVGLGAMLAVILGGVTAPTPASAGPVQIVGPKQQATGPVQTESAQWNRGAPSLGHRGGDSGRHFDNRGGSWGHDRGRNWGHDRGPHRGHHGRDHWRQGHGYWGHPYPYYYGSWGRPQPVWVPGQWVWTGWGWSWEAGYWR